MDTLILETGFPLAGITNLLWMTDDDLIDLHDNGHIVGLHSFTHPTRLVNMSADTQRAEYSANQHHLESLLGTPSTVMSHPCNSYGFETLEILREVGVRFGFRSNMEKIENRSGLEFPRENHSNIKKAMTL